jgi:hypothetical protein
MAKRFRWADGSRLDHVDPQAAGEELERLLEAREGFINANAVVEAARSEESPLHGAFEWNDDKAAHEYRLTQARKVLRSIRVTIEVEDPDETEIVVQRLILDAGPEENRYVRVDIVAGDPALHQEALERATRLLKGIRDRHRELRELDHIWSLIDEL